MYGIVISLVYSVFDAGTSSEDDSGDERLEQSEPLAVCCSSGIMLSCAFSSVFPDQAEANKRAEYSSRGRSIVSGSAVLSAYDTNCLYVNVYLPRQVLMSWYLSCWGEQCDCSGPDNNPVHVARISTPALYLWDS